MVCWHSHTQPPCTRVLSPCPDSPHHLLALYQSKALNKQVVWPYGSVLADLLVLQNLLDHYGPPGVVRDFLLGARSRMWTVQQVTWLAREGRLPDDSPALQQGQAALVAVIAKALPSFRTWLRKSFLHLPLHGMQHASVMQAGGVWGKVGLPREHSLIAQLMPQDGQISKDYFTKFWKVGMPVVVCLLFACCVS